MQSIRILILYKTVALYLSALSIAFLIALALALLYPDQMTKSVAPILYLLLFQTKPDLVCRLQKTLQNLVETVLF